MNNDNTYGTKGNHILVDAYGVSPDLLDNIHYLKALGKFAIAVSGATCVDMVVKKFDPVGCTLLFLLSESHLSFHCSPEHSFISLDLYTCGEHVDPNAAVNYIIEQLKPTEVHRQYIERGVR